MCKEVVKMGNYYDEVRDRALTRAKIDFEIHCNADGVIARSELTNFTKSYLRRMCEGVGGNTSQAEVDFVRKHTGHLLYIKHFNLKERICTECYIRGYVVDGKLMAKELLDRKPMEPYRQWLDRRKKYVQWSKSLNDYVKANPGQTKEQILSEYYGRPVKYINKAVDYVKNDANLIKIISKYADENGCIDSLKKNPKYSTITKWLKLHYHKQGYEHLTHVQSMQKFVNDNCPQYHFSNPVYVPSNKLDVKTRDLYKEAKDGLISYAVDGEITGLKKDEVLYNKVRHVRDLLGYPSIKDCVEAMLADENGGLGIEYNPQNNGARKSIKTLNEIEHDVKALIHSAYVANKKPHEINYKNGKLDVSGMSTTNNNIFKKAYRANKRSNFERQENLNFGSYMDKYYDCYYKSTELNKETLKTNNVFKDDPNM